MKKILLASLLMGSVSAYAQTVKKVILHDYTGINCQYCPQGTVVIEGLQSANPTNFLPVAVHSGAFTPSNSVLRTPEGDALDATANPNGSYPGGSVDMKKYGSNTTLSMNRGSWGAAFNTQKAKTAIVSVGIGNKVDKGGDTYEADINVVFNALPAAGVPLKVQVFIIEDSIKATGALAQINASDGNVVKGGQSPLNPWWHNRVLRKALSGDAWGFTGVIPATPVVGTKYTKKVTFTKDAAWVKKNIHIIAFVAYDGTVAADRKEVLNAEEVSLKTFFPTAVNDVTSNATILDVYPNPASTKDVIKVEYNITENANVSFKIFNALGQLVAQPFQSFEAIGSHTLQWKASEHNLPAGTYIMQLSTPNGMQSQKITLQ